MTPPKESGYESAPESDFTALSPDQVRATLEATGPDSSGLPKLPKGEAKAILEDPISIPVNVVERGSMLPQQAELKVSDDALTLDQIHAEADSALAAVRAASSSMPEESRLTPNLSAAERAVRLSDKDPLVGVSREMRPDDENQIIAEVRESLSGARDLRELKEKAEALAAKGLIAQEGEFTSVKDVGTDVLLRRETELTHVETEKGDDSIAGWFKPIPGDYKSELIMLELERAKQALDKRSKIQRARDKITVNRHHRQTDKVAGVADEILTDLKAKKDSDEHDKKAESWIEEANNFDEYMAEKIAETRRPFEAEIAKLRRDKEGLNKLTSILINKERESERLTKLIGEQQMLMLQAENKTRLAIRAEISRLSEEATFETSKVRDLLASVRDGKTVYEPENDRDPDSVVAISRSISDTVGRRAEPINTDEYKLGDTVMQRLVYETEHDGVVVVEDWDKTAGMLKRQVVMKGKDILVPDYQNENVSERKANKLKKKNKYKMELSKKAHEEIGLIKQEQVASDSDTPYAAGSFAYSGRLKRSGVGAASSYEMASGVYKPRESKGFIAMLRANLEGGTK